MHTNFIAMGWFVVTLTPVECVEWCQIGLQVKVRVKGL